MLLTITFRLDQSRIVPIVLNGAVLLFPIDLCRKLCMVLFIVAGRVGQTLFMTDRLKRDLSVSHSGISSLVFLGLFVSVLCLLFVAMEDKVKQQEKELAALREQLAAQKVELETSRIEVEEARESRTVYVTKEGKKIPKLKGTPKSDEDIDVEEWLDDVKRHIDSRSYTAKEKFDFIMEHLEGPAKWEIRFRFSDKTPDAVTVLETIGQVFGVPDSVTRLQELFFRRNQRDGEGILDYSLALMRLLDKVVKKDSSCIAQQDRFLKGKFTEGVKEESLRRHLRTVNSEKPELAFWELRDKAIKWIGEDVSSVPSNASKKKTLFKKLCAVHQIQVQEKQTRFQ